MAVLEHQQPVLVDRGGGDARRGRRFAGRVSDEQPILEQSGGIDVAAGERQGQQDAIEVAAVQRFARLVAGVLAQEKLEVGPLAAQPRQHRRQQERRDRRDHAHAKLAVERLALRARHVGELLALAQQAHRFVGDLLAERGEAHDAAGALDQHDAEQILELAQAGGQRRLGHEAGLRSLAKMAVLAKRDEILELFDRRQMDCHRFFQSVRSI